MNRVVFALVAILFLLSISSITGLIQIVRADGAPIYINADGSISPSTAPIYTADNITYTLTGNITSATNGIEIERNNIVLNGAGYTVTGSGKGYDENGTTLTNMSNVTVKNMTITNFANGIFLYSSDNSTLSGNTVTNDWEGIVLDSSSDNNTLSGNNVTNNATGIWLESSDNNTLSGNNVTNDFYGIEIDYSSNNVLSGNNVTANSNGGIWLEYSSNCTLSGNNVTANTYGGIDVEESSNCTLSGNNVTANGSVGIFLDSSSDDTLSGNNVTANNGFGITLSDSSNNSIFYNSFVNNTYQILTDGLANVWDNGSVGNYWSDYVTKYPNAVQVDSSGVWNTPYVIDANNTDYYPLIVPTVVVPEFPSFLFLPLFMIATLLAVIIYKKKGVKTSQS
ncbi:MAG: NosD domain-containing protein [Candidatus Bathyarchaeia archaeon]